MDHLCLEFIIVYFIAICKGMVDFQGTSVGISFNNLFINLKNIHLFVSQLAYLQNKKYVFLWKLSIILFFSKRPQMATEVDKFLSNVILQ